MQPAARRWIATWLLATACGDRDVAEAGASSPSSPSAGAVPIEPPPQPAPPSTAPKPSPPASASPPAKQPAPRGLVKHCAVTLAIFRDGTETVSVRKKTSTDAEVQLDAARCVILTERGVPCDGEHHHAVRSSRSITTILGESVHDYEEEFQILDRHRGSSAGPGRDVACRRALDEACTAAGLDACPDTGLRVVEIDDQPADAFRSAPAEPPGPDAPQVECVMTLRAADGSSSVRARGQGASKFAACHDAVRDACSDGACGERAIPKSVDGIPIDLLPPARSLLGKG